MRSYSHLSEDERDQIGVLRAAGRSIGAIARALGRAKATISRHHVRAALARLAQTGIVVKERNRGAFVRRFIIKCLAFEAASLDASVASINAANKKGVPVVQFNGKASGGDYVTFVGSAQTDSGVKLGQFLEALYKKLGKPKLRGVYLRGVAGQVTDIARNDGLKNYLNNAGLGDKIEFVEQYADYDRGKGQAVAESILAKDKTYDFIVANNDDMILGALQAAKQAGLKIPMAGVDGLPEALAAIKSGDLAATVFQDPEGQGGGVWGCFLAVKGVKLPKDFLIPFTLVTPANVDSFAAVAERVYK